MNLADQIRAANGNLPPVPPRPAAATVRTITPLTSSRSTLPDLPRVTTTDPRLLRAQASRDAIYALLETGLYSRQQIADATGIDPDREGGMRCGRWSGLTPEITSLARGFAQGLVD